MTEIGLYTLNNDQPATKVIMSVMYLVWVFMLVIWRVGFPYKFDKSAQQSPNYLAQFCISSLP